MMYATIVIAVLLDSASGYRCWRCVGGDYDLLTIKTNKLCAESDISKYNDEYEAYGPNYREQKSKGMYITECKAHEVCGGRFEEAGGQMIRVSRRCFPKKFVPPDMKGNGYTCWNGTRSMSTYVGLRKTCFRTCNTDLCNAELKPAVTGVLRRRINRKCNKMQKCKNAKKCKECKECKECYELVYYAIKPFYKKSNSV